MLRTEKKCLLIIFLTALMPIACNSFITEQKNTIEENSHTITDSNKIDRLITTLKDKDPEVSEQAAKELSKIGTPAVEPLIEALKYSRISDYPSLEWWEAAKYDRADVRCRAARALGEIGDARAVESLCVALDDDEGLVRLSALEALVRIGDNRCIPCLVAAFENDWVVIRKKAAYALDKFGWKPKDEKERIAYVVSKQNWDECVKIGELAVGRLVSTFGILNTSNAGNDQPVSAAISETLAKIGKPAARPLVATLKERYHTYGDIERAIMRMGEPAVEPLIAALKDKDSYFRSDAARLLGRIGDKRAVEPLIAVLTEYKEAYNEEVIHALAVLKDKRAVKPLVALLEEDLTKHELKDRRIRSNAVLAASALGRIGDSNAVNALIGSLKNDDFHVRTAAAAALGYMGDKRAIEPLENALKDQEWSVSQNALNSLKKLGWQKYK